MSEIGSEQRPVHPEQASQAGGATPPPAAAPSSTPGSTPAAGFEFNRPTIISLLYISSTVLGVTALVGVVLAYVWRNEPHEPWEDSHYRYLINTFWIALIGTTLGIVLLIVLIGLAVLAAVAVLVVVRCILSLINAQKRLPMPNPGTLLA